MVNAYFVDKLSWGNAEFRFEKPAKVAFAYVRCSSQFCYGKGGVSEVAVKALYGGRKIAFPFLFC